VGSQPMAIAIVFSAIDILCARYLTVLASEKEEKWKIAAQFAALYGKNVLTWRFLFNPFTLATCLGRSSSVFSNLAVLASIAHAHQGTQSLRGWLLTEGLGGSAMVELAMAGYLSLYPALLLPPLLLFPNLKVAALISQCSLKDINTKIIGHFRSCITCRPSIKLCHRRIMVLPRFNLRRHVPLPALTTSSN